MKIGTDIEAIRQSYADALVECGNKNEKIIVLDADVSGATKTNKFKNIFPDRFLNVGICEQNLIGIGCGLYSHGFIPILNTFSMFALGRAYDQIRNSVCYPKANVKIIGTHYGLTVGKDGATHQMLEDISLANTIPNLDVYCPSDRLSTKIVLENAINSKNPTYIRISRYEVPTLYEENDIVQLKKGYYEHGNGIDGIIYTTGDVSYIAYLAQMELKEKYNIDVKVVDIFKIKPLDFDMIIRNSKNAKKIVSIENHNKISGLGSIITNVLNENNIFNKVNKIGVADEFGQSGDASELLEFYGITKEKIIENFIS